MEEKQLANPSIEPILERLAALKPAIAEKKALTDEYNDLRTQAQYILAASGSDKSKPHAGVYALISRKEELAIVDEDALAAWLEDNTMDPDSYYTKTLNREAIKALAAERLDEDGELLPGLQTRTVETVNIRSTK